MALGVGQEQPPQAARQRWSSSVGLPPLVERGEVDVRAGLVHASLSAIRWLSSTPVAMVVPAPALASSHVLVSSRMGPEVSGSSWPSWKTTMPSSRRQHPRLRMKPGRDGQAPGADFVVPDDAPKSV